MTARATGLHAVLAVAAILTTGVGLSASATVLPVPSEYAERIYELLEEQKGLKEDLTAIREQFDSETLGTEEGVNTSHAVNNLFSLLDKLARNRKDIEALKKELDDLFTSPPPLKLVRISGPEPGIRGTVDQIETRYNPGSSGFSRHVWDVQERPKSVMGLAVTYAPLEIVPGEPFHFEAVARGAISRQTRDCSGTSPDRLRLGIDSVVSAESLVVFSRTDLNCEAASVSISLRLKAHPPLHDGPSEIFKFLYTMEAATDGMPGEENTSLREVEKEILDFRLPEKKSAVELGDRGFYALDVSVWMSDAGSITLHYRPVDESIAFLPQFQFPEDAVGFKISVPDVIRMTRKEAIAELSQRRLSEKIVIGPVPPSADLAGRVASQTPLADTRVEGPTTVTLTLYSNYARALTVPDVMGLTLEAARTVILNAGLEMVRWPGDKPPSSDLQGTIERQSPAAGTKVEQNSTVTVYVYGPYVDSVIVPDLNNMVYTQARDMLTPLGLSLKERDGGSPGRSDLVGRVARQAPSAGTEVIRSSEVSVWFYGQYIPTPEEQVAQSDCRRFPGSRAYWDSDAGAPRCGCFDGLQWNTAQTACITPDQAAQEVCARDFPGSIFTGRSGRGIECGCPEGYTWAVNNTHCEKLIPPNELCARNYPGSIPTGRDAGGMVICDCPDGYAWANDPRRCVRISTGGGGGNNRNHQDLERINQCNHLISQIKAFMGLYMSDPQNNRHLKNIAETNAQQARTLGCDAGQISQALGTGGGGGNRQQETCPDGYYMGDDGTCALIGGSTFGQ